MIGVIATWDTIWQGVSALETFVDSGFKDTSGFDKFHESMGILEQVSISAYDNIAEAWEKQQKLLDEINTKNAQKELETMGKEGTDNFSEIQKSAADTQKTIDGMHGTDIVSTHTIITNFITNGSASGGISGGPSETTKTEASGGILGRDEYISDLGLWGKKGEAWIPAELVKAIRENRPSFAGLDVGGSAANTYNLSINIEKLSSRDDADYFAEQIYNKFQTQSRLGT
jgi:hypothetical protein